jgi:hypothetical protein
MSEQTNGGSSASPSPATPAAPAGKGPSLITVVGLIALAVLIVVLIYAYVNLKAGMNNPVVQDVIKISPAVKEMADMTQSQISEQAEKHTAEELMKDPSGLSGRYVQVEGDVSRDESMMVSEQIAVNAFSDEDRPGIKGCVLDDGLVFLDITGELPELSEGTRIRGFGKVLEVNVKDIFALPWVGPDLKKEFGNLEGEKVVIFLSKGYQEVAPAQGTGAVDDSQKAAHNPATPADAGNPCGGAAANPCGGKDANPCGGGDSGNPCGGGEANPCQPSGGDESGK